MVKILIVDDSLAMRSRDAHIIKQLGYDSIDASDGSIAIKMYQEQKPDLVLMDIAMTGLDGLETTKEIIKIDADAKIIMLTAINQQQYIIEAMRSGAKDYMVKPLNGEKLKALVNQWVK